MKGCLKTALVVTGCILILVAVAAIVLGLHANSYAKDILQASARYATGTKITIDKVRFLPLQQSMEILGVNIENPPQFEACSAIAIPRIGVVFDGKTLFSANPTIKQVVVEGAKVHIQYALGQGTNLNALTEPAEASQSDKPPASRRFVIQEFQCKGTKVSLAAGSLPLAGVDFEVAPFTLTGDVANRAVTPAEITKIFLKTLVKETLTVKGLLKPVSGVVEGQLKSLLGVEKQ